MSTFARPQTADTHVSQAPHKQTKERVIRFASRKQAQDAGDWAIKKYASVFKKLAQ